MPRLLPIFIALLLGACSKSKNSSSSPSSPDREYIRQSNPQTTQNQNNQNTANQTSIENPSGSSNQTQNSSTTSSDPETVITKTECLPNERQDCLSKQSSEKAKNILQIIDNQNAIAQMNRKILTAITPDNSRVESKVYRWADFLEAYKIIALEGIDGKTFFPGTNEKAGLINIAIFLGQSMHETIQYDACDENNWSIGLGYPDYPATASCGQAGQDYSAYNCSEAEKHMQCPVDTQMIQQAGTMAPWYGAPPPLFCAPTSVTGTALPRWNAFATCTPEQSVAADVPSWVNDNIKTLNNPSCTAYPLQKAGAFTLDGCDATGCQNASQMDTEGGIIRTDVAGCCWWGRGVIQTTGVCNFGKLNYYLAGWEYRDNGSGNRVKKQYNPNAKYASLNICENPNSICQGPKELKWIAGMFYWMDSVQGYQSSEYPDFDFLKILEKDAEDIFQNPNGTAAKALVDSTSGLVNRGCPLATCPGSGAVLKLGERFENFQMVMEVFKELYQESLRL